MVHLEVDVLTRLKFYTYPGIAERGKAGLEETVR